MKKLFLFVFFTAYVYGAVAGEIVSAGFGRDVALKGAGVTFSPTLFNKDWTRCQLKGGWTPGNDGAYGFSILDGGDKIADALCARLARMGYNALRIHHYALRADGSRRYEVPSSWDGKALTFTANTARDTSDATFLYEIERK